MDFKFDSVEEEFRSEVKDFIDKELPWNWREEDLDAEDEVDSIKVMEFKKKLGEQGWLTMAWPTEYGGQSATHMRQVVFNEEMAYRGIPAGDAGVRMVGPILMLYGTDEQKEQFLPKIANAEINWSQGYSEPDSGSDLASLQTKAVEDGDDFVVSGSKIWNSAHAGSDWMFMLVRTDPDAPKHRGISFVLVDMKSPGVTVRPIINMAGGHEFNQVTFDDVRVPRANVVGDEDRGWYVAVTLLDFERSGIDYSAAARRMLDDVREFATETKRNGQPLIEIPWVRSLMADRYIDCEVARLMAYNVAYMQSQDLIPTKEASMSKVFGSETVQRVTEASLDILGQYGTLGREDKWAPLKGRVQEHWMNAFAGTIAAGTSEVQRNIIAGRGLGLPRG